MKCLIDRIKEKFKDLFLKIKRKTKSFKIQVTDSWKNIKKNLKDLFMEINRITKSQKRQRNEFEYIKSIHSGNTPLSSKFYTIMMANLRSMKRQEDDRKIAASLEYNKKKDYIVKWIIKHCSKLWGALFKCFSYVSNNSEVSEPITPSSVDVLNKNSSYDFAADVRRRQYVKGRKAIIAVTQRSSKRVNRYRKKRK